MQPSSSPRRKICSHRAKAEPAKHHRPVAKILNDALGKLTSDWVARLIGMENLNVAVRVASHFLGGAITYPRCRELGRQLGCKAQRTHTIVVLADHCHVSAKLYSTCGHQLCRFATLAMVLSMSVMRH